MNRHLATRVIFGASVLSAVVASLIIAASASAFPLVPPHSGGITLRPVPHAFVRESFADNTITATSMRCTGDGSLVVIWQATDYTDVGYRFVGVSPHDDGSATTFTQTLAQRAPGPISLTFAFTQSRSIGSFTVYETETVRGTANPPRCGSV